MRHVCFSLFVITAAALATGASADSPAATQKVLPQPMLRTSSSGTAAATNRKPTVQSTAAHTVPMNPAKANVQASKVEVAKAAAPKPVAPMSMSPKPVVKNAAAVAPKPVVARATVAAAKPIVAKVAVAAKPVRPKASSPKPVVVKVAVVPPKPVMPKTMALNPAMRKVTVAEPKLVARKVAVVLAKPVRKHIVTHRSTSISVPLDEVRVVAFSQPIATVYVGNPMIADVSMIDSRHAFVLGKGFGATNIVALDADGKQVINDPINVFGHTGNTVVLHRGTHQATLTCGNARCEALPTPGDDKELFSNRMDEIVAHQDAGVKAAGAGR
jgi:Flp pilus assembly secretin CpaC